ncbi:MAG: hypothetical protein H2041_01295 [Phenylobacterium sp.]|uniref:hypothetical protein n=1 Tax=Phenylobacterium sp. TaxID=1871053 RepID=UPI00179C8650|nr:hypothetical protein [Phenylobacterium sp.]MBA4792281.1 hypothetical protein [Phenylobacterium sp.]
MSTALERLADGYYNSGLISPANPGGLAGNGHVTNFPAALADVGAVASDIASAVNLVLSVEGNAQAAALAAGAAQASADEAAGFAAAIDPARIDALERRAKFLFCLSVS